MYADNKVPENGFDILVTITPLFINCMEESTEQKFVTTGI